MPVKNTSAPQLAAPRALPHPQPASCAPAPNASLVALCAIARLLHVAADSATLAHHLGLAPLDTVTIHDLLRAAQHLGLKAKRSRPGSSRPWSGQIPRAPPQKVR